MRLHVIQSSAPSRIAVIHYLVVTTHSNRLMIVRSYV